MYDQYRYCFLKKVQFLEVKTRFEYYQHIGTCGYLSLFENVTLLRFVSLSGTNLTKGKIQSLDEF
jgi:hypothetical protein